MEVQSSRERGMGVAASVPTPTLTVAAVARRLGVAPPTLRTWDRRYGLGPSAHTAGAHRRYSPGDVARLMVMRRLTLEGVSPADAARIALATSVADDGRPMHHTPADGYDLSGQPTDDSAAAAPGRPGPPGLDRAPEPHQTDETTPRNSAPGQNAPNVVDPAVVDRFCPTEAFDPVDRFRVAAPASELTSDDPGSDFDPGSGSEAGSDPGLGWGGGLLPVPPERGTAGGGRVVAMPAGTPQSRGLARAAMSLDTHETDRILRDVIRREGVIATWDSMIMPVLRALGERTRVTGDGIDVEHAFTEVILGVMRAVAFSRHQPRNSPVVLLACADSDYHSLPLHALAAALAERDVPTRMLGSGLPPHALSASVRRTGPSVIVLFARMMGADASDVESLRRQRPAPTIVLAGPGWRPETIPTSARTAASLVAAVTEVQRALHT